MGKFQPCLNYAIFLLQTSRLHSGPDIYLSIVAVRSGYAQGVHCAIHIKFS